MTAEKMTSGVDASFKSDGPGYQVDFASMENTPFYRTGVPSKCNVSVTLKAMGGGDYTQFASFFTDLRRGGPVKWEPQPELSVSGHQETKSVSSSTAFAAPFGLLVACVSKDKGQTDTDHCRRWDLRGLETDTGWTVEIGFVNWKANDTGFPNQALVTIKLTKVA